jgi:hypothetical protein
MRIQPVTYRIKQAIPANPTVGFSFPVINPTNRLRLRWFGVGMAGSSTLTAQPVIFQVGSTHQFSASIVANNNNITMVRTDFWLNEGDAFGFALSGVNTGGIVTFVMSGTLYTLEDSDLGNPWPIPAPSDTPYSLTGESLEP